VNTYNLLRSGVIASIILIQFGSVSHLAYTFATIENKENSLVGWVLALGIEIALAFTAFGLKEQARFKDKSQGAYLRRYLIGFCAINLWGNYFYGVDRLDLIGRAFGDIVSRATLDHINVIVLSASLPLISLALIEVYAVVSKRIEIDAKKPAELKPKKTSEAKPKPPARPKKSALGKTVQQMVLSGQQDVQILHPEPKKKDQTSGDTASV
jgi:hypothetical protein